MKRRKGFTLIELLVVVAIIALLISILLPSLARAREITKRAVCASNIRGIGQGLKVYSNDNYDWYPVAPYERGDSGSGDPNAMAVDFVGMMGMLHTTELTSDNDTAVHPSRSLFMLVIEGTCTVKQFICPSSGDSEDDLRNIQGNNEVAAQPGRNRFDFKGYPYVSYGYQLPFGPKGRPNENLDTRMAIMADKGPFFDADSANDEGVVPDQYAMNLNDTVSLPGINGATEILQADNDEWSDYNSRNHAGEGQNVLFQDGHAEFVKKPIVGAHYDNIYTYQDEDGTLEGTMLGNRPEDQSGPMRNTDSVMVP